MSAQSCVCLLSQRVPASKNKVKSHDWGRAAVLDIPVGVIRIFSQLFPSLAAYMLFSKRQCEWKRKIHQNGRTWASGLERQQFRHWFFAYSLLLGIFFWRAELAAERQRHIKQLVRQYSNSSEANNHTLGFQDAVECQWPDRKQHVSLNQENLFETAWVKFPRKNRRTCSSTPAKVNNWTQAVIVLKVYCKTRETVPSVI